MKGKWTIIKVKNCEILVISIIIPSCQMKYRELEYFVKKILPAAINFEFNPNNPDNRVAVEKSILQTESRISEQISEHQRTSKKDPFK